MYVESDLNAKFDVFSGCLFYHYDTTFSAKTVYLRESGKFGSLSELKTPVKRSLFLNNKKKMDLPVQHLEYTEIYIMILRKVIREAKTRKNDRYFKASYKKNSSVANNK